MKLKPAINLVSRKQRVMWFMVITGGVVMGGWALLHFLGRSTEAPVATASPVNFVELKDSQFSSDDAASAMQTEETQVSSLQNQVTDLKAADATASTTEANTEQQQMNALQQQLANVQATRNQGETVTNAVLPPSPVNNFTLTYLAPPVDQSPSTQNYVPSNSWAKAVMIQGADANAAVSGQNNTTPVIFQIVSNATGPNNSTYPLKGCRVSGAAYGDISSERAEIQLVSLSCVRADGSILDIPVKGEVADISGKEGIRGVPVMRNGQILFNAGVSGFMSGIGQSLQQSMQTQSVSPLGSTSTVNSGQTLQYGLAGGGSTALTQLASYYIQRAEQYHPIIEVNAGSVVDIVFLTGFSLNASIGNTQNTQTTAPSNNASPYAPQTYTLNSSSGPAQVPGIQNAEAIMQQVNQAQFGQTIGLSGS